MRSQALEFNFTVNYVFDRLTEVKEAPKTNKPDSSAYIGTVESGLCSKSKCLAQQAVLTPHPSKIIVFCHILVKEKAFARLSIRICVLTVWGFFDTVNRLGIRAKAIIFVAIKGDFGYQ